jgi:hypothetical protein
VGHASQGSHADVGAPGVDRNRPPAKNFQPLVDGDRLDAAPLGIAGNGILRKEADSRGKGVGALARWRRKVEVDDLGEKLYG